MSRVPEPVDFVAALETALRTVTEEEASLQVRLDELAQERRGLELAVRRYKVPASIIQSGSFGRSTTIRPIEEPSPPTEASAPGMSPEMAARAAEEIEAAELGDDENPDSEKAQPATATMTDTVTEILRQAPEPLGPKDIVAVVNSMGMEGDYSQVRGTIGYLNRKKLLRQIRRGAWVLKGSEADRLHPDDDIFADVDVPTNAETPAAVAAEVSDAVPSQEEGDRIGAVMAS